MPPCHPTAGRLRPTSLCSRDKQTDCRDGYGAVRCGQRRHIPSLLLGRLAPSSCRRSFGDSEGSLPTCMLAGAHVVDMQCAAGLGPGPINQCTVMGRLRARGFHAHVAVLCSCAELLRVGWHGCSSVERGKPSRARLSDLSAQGRTECVPWHWSSVGCIVCSWMDCGW
jgi:hypothetical protein